MKTVSLAEEVSPEFGAKRRVRVTQIRASSMELTSLPADIQTCPSDARILLVIAALAACPTAHHVQVGISNLQDRQDIISVIPECTPDSCCT